MWLTLNFWSGFHVYCSCGQEASAVPSVPSQCAQGCMPLSAGPGPQARAPPTPVGETENGSRPACQPCKLLAAEVRGKVMGIRFGAGERNRIIWEPEGHRLGGLEERGVDLGGRSQDWGLWGSTITRGPSSAHCEGWHLVPKQPGHRGAPWINLSAHPCLLLPSGPHDPPLLLFMPRSTWKTMGGTFATGS